MNKINFLTNLTILLVEDDASALRQMEIMLRKKCGKVYTANNGMVGLKVYQTAAPDVIVTDLKMPVMGGLEMSRQVRKTNPDIPIIITTAFDDKDIILSAIDVGINKYIIQPVDADALLGALGEVSASVLKLRDGILTGDGFIVDREEKLKKEGDSISTEYRVRRRDGEIRHVMGNIKLLKENGRMFYQRFLLDYTAQKLQDSAMRP